MDAIFEAMQTLNAMGLLLGGLVMLLIGGVMIGDWLNWRLKAYRVKARIVAIQASGKRRTDDEWRDHYQSQKKSDTKQTPTFKQDFKHKPVSTSFATLFVGLFLFIPFVFFGIGAYTAFDYLSLRMTGVETVARVVDIHESYDSDNGTTYAPVLSYTDTNGYDYREQDKLSTGSNSYAVGEKVTIYYNSDKPTHFVMDRFWRYMGFAFAFMGMGGLFIGFGVFGYFYKEKKAGRLSEVQLRKHKRRQYAKQFYTAIYEFVTPQGETLQAPGSMASNSVADKILGEDVVVLVHPDKPEKVRKLGYLFLILGAVFAAPGLFLTYLSFSMMSFGFGGFLAMGIIVLYIGFKLSKSVRVGKDRLSRQGWTKKAKERIKTKKRKGYELTPEEIRARLEAHDHHLRWGLPIGLLFSLGLIVGGYIWAQHVSDFTARAMSAQGQVVSLNSKYSDGNYTYYPVVSFMTDANETFKFEDNVGSNPPSKQKGDVVAVLYDPVNPNEAMIDRGIWNNIPAWGLIVFGIYLLLYCWRSWRGLKRRQVL